MRSALFTTVFTVLATAPAAAQVLETPQGPVEFIGLQHRTAEEVRDTLRALRPDLTLHSREVRDVLRDELGFAEVAMAGFRGFGLPEGYLTITVVEPEEADGVRYAEPPPDSLPPVEAWAEAYALYPDQHWAWPYALAGIAEAPEAPDDTSVPAVRGFLAAHTAPAELERALVVLERDRNPINRSIAAAILTSFPERDAAWHALVRAVRGHGPDDASRAMATMALAAMVNRGTKTVDWTPVADDLRALLDGTTLFALPQVLTLLSRSRVDAELADELLAGGGELVLAHLTMRVPSTRTRAMDVLEKLSGGVSYGTEPARWRAWIQTL